MKSSSLTFCPGLFSLQGKSDNSKDGGKKKAKGAGGDTGGRSEVSMGNYCFINAITYEMVLICNLKKSLQKVNVWSQKRQPLSHREGASFCYIAFIDLVLSSQSEM